MIQELSAKEMEERARIFVSLKTEDIQSAYKILKQKFKNVRIDDDHIKVFDEEDTEGIVKYLIENNHVVSEVKKNKVGLEEYYIELMSKKESA